MNKAIKARALVKRSLGLMGFAALACGVLMLGASHVSANSRDSDGSRLQAGSMSLGSSVSDTLLPPRDYADWRSFKVTAQGNVSLSVKHTPANAKVVLSLTDARGKSVASATSASGLSIASSGV